MYSFSDPNLMGFYKRNHENECVQRQFICFTNEMHKISSLLCYIITRVITAKIRYEDDIFHKIFRIKITRNCGQSV